MSGQRSSTAEFPVVDGCLPGPTVDAGARLDGEETVRLRLHCQWLGRPERQRAHHEQLEEAEDIG